ncbi:hypothetical protein ACTHGU_05440 [Chitinophagaceae bacterium MMS25-I14]
MNTFDQLPCTADAVTGCIISFLESIGIGVEFTEINEPCFLPGILVQQGRILADPKLFYPGDLLHEAGHIAVMSPEDRIAISGDIGSYSSQDKSAGEELMAIAWSYAACVYLDMDPAVVFHPDGYKGASSWYIKQFTSGIYIGLPMLQWIGLCKDARNAAEAGTPAYPHMLQWMRT